MKINTLQELIEKIKERPSSFIGKNSIFCLESFLFGVTFVKKWDDEEILKDFQKWIAKEYRIKTSHSWSSILNFYSSNEYTALEKFFNEFDKFLKERYPQ